MVKDHDIELFHDQFNKPYISLNEGGRRIMKLNSSVFKNWLISTAWKKLETAPANATVTTATSVLIGEACNDGKLYKLHVRVAWHEGYVWYDLGNGSAVKINEKGWHVEQNPPILFYRFPHQEVQVTPQEGGNITDVLKMLNLKNEGEQLLFLVALVSCFMPNIAHPVLVSHGPQGSAKTSLHKVLKSIVDPSAIDMLTSPKEMREFIQVAAHHWVICLDNLSHLPDWLSDALCKVCTGSGFSKRELYTDDDDVIYNFKHIVGLNGISLVATKPDLLDRSILFAHEMILDKQRMKEKVLTDMLAQRKPLILGAIFEILAKSIALKPSINIDNPPRMADFAEWGCAITIVMKRNQEDFLTAYKHNIEQQHDEALEASLVGTAIFRFMEDRGEYEATATELLRTLKMYSITDLGVSEYSKSWPKNPNMIWKEIMKVKTNLYAKGIIAERTKSGIRKIILKKL